MVRKSLTEMLVRGMITPEVSHSIFTANQLEWEIVKRSQFGELREIVFKL